MHHHHYHTWQSFVQPKTLFGYELPDANEHPLFYIGIYATIGLVSALASVLSVTAQYTGSLRASRILFKSVCFDLYSSLTYFSISPRKLLVTVVRATFRFHDTTPQGDY